jgi:hypothetical protein
VNAGSEWSVRTPADEDSTIGRVELEQWWSWRDVAHQLGLSQPRALSILRDDQSHLRQYSERTSASRRSFSKDAFLRMASVSSHWRWALSSQHSVYSRTMYCAWGCFRIYSSRRIIFILCRERWCRVCSSVIIWALIVGDIVMDSYLLTGWLLNDVTFWNLFCLGCSKICMWLSDTICGCSVNVFQLGVKMSSNDWTRRGQGGLDSGDLWYCLLCHRI